MDVGMEGVDSLMRGGLEIDLQTVYTCFACASAIWQHEPTKQPTNERTWSLAIVMVGRGYYDIHVRPRFLSPLSWSLKCNQKRTWYVISI